MLLMSLAIIITPVVSAQTACDVPASNSWPVEQNTNQHTVENPWDWTEEDNDIEIMGIEHKDYPIYGLQFHPESILTTSGHQLLKNFLEI